MEDIKFSSSLSQKEMKENFAGFDFFDGLLQAYVFVFLTGLYLTEAVE